MLISLAPLKRREVAIVTHVPTTLPSHLTTLTITTQPLLSAPQISPSLPPPHNSHLQLEFCKQGLCWIVERKLCKERDQRSRNLQSRRNHVIKAHITCAIYVDYAITHHTTWCTHDYMLRTWCTHDHMHRAWCTHDHMHRTWCTHDHMHKIWCTHHHMHRTWYTHGVIPCPDTNESACTPQICVQFIIFA